MSQAILDRLTAEREEIESYVTRTLEGVEGRDLSDAEVRSINDSKARIEAIDAQIKPLVDFMSTRSAATDMTRLISTGIGRSATAETRSLGEIFTESDVFTSYTGRGTSSRLQIEERALPHTLTSVAAGLPAKQRIDLSEPVVEGPLLGLVGTIQVSTNAIEAVKWAKKAGGAAVVPEGTAKPSVEWEPTVVPYTLETVAAYTQATRQLLEDAPAIRSLIDTELRREVTRKFESEAAAALVAATLPTATDTTLLRGIRKGIGVVQAAGYAPNAVLLNPADFADMDIEVFGSTLLGPSRSGSFWGLRPVPSNAQPAGTATVGDFAAGVQRYVRSGVSLYITDSHGETFLTNVFTLLAEGRAKTIVTRPAALVEVTATP